MQNRHYSTFSPTPEARGPSGSTWRGPEVVDNVHMLVGRDSKAEPRKGSRADIAENAMAPPPKAMSGDKADSPVAPAYRVSPH